MDTAPFMVPIPAVRHPCQLGLDDQCQGSSSSAINYYHCRQHNSPSAKGQHTIFSANRVNIFLPAKRDIFLFAKTDTFPSVNREPSISSSSAINYYHCRQHIFLSARRKPGPFSDICCALLFHPWSSVSVPNSCLLPVRCSYVTALLYMYLHCISASISLADILYCCIQPYWAVKYVYVCSIYCCCL